MSYHTCIINNNGLLKCWGFNSYGQLGLGDTNSRGDELNEMGVNLPFVNIGDGSKVDQVSIGEAFTCVHLTNSQVKCWGYNNYGQLGLGIYDLGVGDTPQTTPDKISYLNLGTESTPIQIKTGNNFTCVLFANKLVKCFGNNGNGQTGLEGVTGDIGKVVDDMGNNLPNLKLGTNTLVESLYGNGVADHICVKLAETQLMKCWGNNNGGQLGYGDTANRGKDVGTMGDNLSTVDLGNEDRIKQIALGLMFTCVLRIDDELKCWGLNGEGQFGSGSRADISSMGTSLISTPYDTGKKIKQISAGFGNLCILYDDNLIVKCVGNNLAGQLGQGDTENRGNLPKNLIPDIPAIDLGTGSLKISYIYSATGFNCVEFVDKRVKCFGAGNYGVLGYGNLYNVGGGLGEMGLKLPFVDLLEPTTNPTNAPKISNPIKNPTSKPTKPPTKAPIKNPTKAPTLICSYPVKKQCNKDNKCEWKKKKCSVFDCTKYLERSTCIADIRCKWKDDKCQIQFK